MRIQDEIAQAIQEADNSYFFENYTKQAAAVMHAIDKSGYMLVPKTPTEAMVKTASDAILSGKMKPSQHVLNVYQTMLAAMKTG